MFLVVGATGYLGGMIARNLITKGYSVRVLVREGSNSQPLEELGAEVVIGDMQNSESLISACRGMKTVLSTAGTRTLDYDESVQATDVQGYQNLIKAARAAGVDRFLYISALGADSDSPIPYLAAKGQIEADLRASGSAYTIFRPSYFMDFWFMGLVYGPAMNGQPVWVMGDGSDAHWPVASRDVAEIVTKAAINPPSTQNRVFVVAGPQPLSLQDAASAARRILGKPVCVKTLDPAAPPPELSPLSIQLMSLGQIMNPCGETLAGDREFGIQLTTLDDYLSMVLGVPATREMNT